MPGKQQYTIMKRDKFGWEECSGPFDNFLDADLMAGFLRNEYPDCTFEALPTLEK